MDGELDFVLERVKGATGAVQGGAGRRWSPGDVSFAICCRIDRRQWVWRVRQSKGRGLEEERESAASPVGVEFGRGCSQVCGDPTSDFIVLRWNQRERKKEAGEEWQGVL
jgi:hypothetical protein